MNEPDWESQKKTPYQQHPHRLQDPPRPEAQAYESQPHGDQEHNAFGTSAAMRKKPVANVPKMLPMAPHA